VIRPKTAKIPVGKKVKNPSNLKTSCYCSRDRLSVYRPT